MSKDTMERKGAPSGAGTERANGEGLVGRLGSARLGSANRGARYARPDYKPRFPDPKAVYADLKVLNDIGNLVDGEIRGGHYLNALFLLESLPLEYRPATDPLYLGIAVGMAAAYGQEAENNPALRAVLDCVTQYCFQRAGRYDLAGESPGEPYQIPSVSAEPALGYAEGASKEGPAYR